MRITDIGKFHTAAPEGSKVTLYFTDQTRETGFVVKIEPDSIKLRLNDNDIEISAQKIDIQEFEVLSRISAKAVVISIPQASSPDKKPLDVTPANNENNKVKNKKNKNSLHAKLETDIQNNDYIVAKNSRDITPLLILDARIPIEYWSVGWLFRNILDIDWLEITKNSSDNFPSTLRKDHKIHPGYLIGEVGPYEIELVPLTSRTKRKKNLHIPAGTRLEPTGHVFDKTSYLVMGALARLPRSRNLFKKIPKFLGIYPPEKFKNLELSR